MHPKSEVKFNIKLFDVANDFVFQKQFGDYQSKAVEEQKLPIIKYANVFEAEVTYKLDAWQNGVDLNDIDDCKEKLELAYDKIIKMIQNNQFDDYTKLISKREENMAISMYLTKTESEARISELSDDFKSGFKIQPISQDAVMFVCAENKVAFLKKINGESALFLKNEDTEEELILDISFYIPEGKKKFVVI